MTYKRTARRGGTAKRHSINTAGCNRDEMIKAFHQKLNEMQASIIHIM